MEQGVQVFQERISGREEDKGIDKETEREVG